jgi:hypothetical protein
MTWLRYRNPFSLGGADVSVPSVWSKEPRGQRDLFLLANLYHGKISYLEEIFSRIKFVALHALLSKTKRKQREYDEEIARKQPVKNDQDWFPSFRGFCVTKSMASKWRVSSVFRSSKYFTWFFGESECERASGGENGGRVSRWSTTSLAPRG